MTTFKNPVLEGFSPDPSVCSVGDDYYLVTSSFAYFPGVPIYHSKDLVNWKQIGNILEREEQLNLLGADHSGGIFAPTIRYHEGTFYMITTNVTHGGNFVVTAKNPAGPWSNPYYIEGAPGIDPSLFFDDDGRCYYSGTRPNPTGVTYNGDWEVWLQEFDVDAMALIGVSTKIWKGSMINTEWPEAPHIYKRNGFYYVMIAEGGTSVNHSVTIARSEKIDGPYIGFKNNPILTHRHLGHKFPIRYVGHGDLVETPDSKWYMTCLASRNFEGYSNLGRETFLAEVVWEEDWPVVNPGIGRLLEEQAHGLPLVPVEQPTKFHFNEMHPDFLFIRNPQTESYDFQARPDWLRMKPTPVKVTEVASPTYIGLRQQSMSYELAAHLDVQTSENSEAGLVIVQSDKYSIRLVATPKENGLEVKMITHINGLDTIVGTQSIQEKEITLALIGEGQLLKGIIRIGEQELLVAEKIDSHYLSTEVAGGFVGCTLGVYCTSDDQNPGYLDVEWLELIK